MRARTLVVVFWLVTVAGCGKHEDLAQPVSWYEQRGTERDAKVAWCGDDSQRQRTPDCMNAAEARAGWWLAPGRSATTPKVEPTTSTPAATMVATRR